MTKHLINEYKLRIFYGMRNIYTHPTIKGFVRHGLKPLKIKNLSPERLNIIRPVLCNQINSNQVVLLPWYEEYFKNDWSLKKSMLLRLLENLYDRDISKPEVKKTFIKQDYYKMHIYLRSLGGLTREDNWIKSKIISFIKLARNIERNGYEYSHLSNYIVVLREPMCKSRYGIEHQIDGYEIYTGHHRAACAAFLGIKSLWVVVAKDVARYTPFGRCMDDLVTTF